MFSIIIPAYNEATVISQTLNFLLNDKCLNGCEIIVVCNGCLDNTAEVVASYKTANLAQLGERNIALNIEQLAQGSKTQAINLGLSVKQYAQVVLLDADIHITGENIIRLVAELYEPNIEVASPKITFDYHQSSWLVRQYYKIAEQSLYNSQYRISNVIALSKNAVEQLGALPEVIADDEYLRRQFSLAQCSLVASLQHRFICPKNVRNLLNALTRVERGNIQLKQLFIENNYTVAENKPRFSITIVVFYGIKTVVKLRAKWQVLINKKQVWLRDESTR